MVDKLVNVLIPVYNGARYIHRLFDSLLIQTYSNIEIFVVDDGSSDDTKSVIESYIPKFAEKKYKLNYIYQENAGQSAAINNGLK